MERETGIEPATNGLGSRDSTTELLPPVIGITAEIVTLCGIVKNLPTFGLNTWVNARFHFIKACFGPIGCHSRALGVVVSQWAAVRVGQAVPSLFSAEVHAQVDHCLDEATSRHSCEAGLREFTWCKA